MDNRTVQGSRQVTVAVFLALVVTGLLLNVGGRPLDFEEPRRGLVALEMGLRGDWLVPTTNGARYLNKPPVFAWVLLGMMRLLGSTAEWVVRLPTVASHLLSAWLVYRVARGYLPGRTAFTAAAMSLTFTTLLFYGTLSAEIDVFYSLIVTAQVLAIFHFEQTERPLALHVVSYLLAALGALTKGVPSVAFQGLTLVAWLAHTRKLRTLLSWQHLAGLGVFALCVGGYFLAYAQRADPVPYLAKLLLESSDRTAAGAQYAVTASLLYLAVFPLQLLALLLPWSAFVPLLLRKEVRSSIGGNPLLRFCLLFVAVNLVPYWLSPGTRPRYLFPFLPFAAVLLAAALEQVRREGWYPRLVEGAFGVCVAAAAAFAIAVPFTPLRSFLSAPALWAAVCAGLLALTVTYWRHPGARMMVVLLALATVRVGYDLVVPAIRDATSEARFYREVAAALNERHAQEPIRLAGRVGEITRDLPVLGRKVTFRETEWFSYALSFYYTAGRRQILEYAGALEPGRLYLARAGHAVGRRHQVLETFRSPKGEAEDLVLFRVLE